MHCLHLLCACDFIRDYRFLILCSWQHACITQSLYMYAITHTKFTLTWYHLLTHHCVHAHPHWLIHGWHWEAHHHYLNNVVPHTIYMYACNYVYNYMIRDALITIHIIMVVAST